MVAKQKTEAKSPTDKKTPVVFRPFIAIGRYFKGAWFELSQVRWPGRKASWGLTLAVILYSLFFAAIILLLDQVFQKLFTEVIL